MKIDIFCHILTEKYKDALHKAIGSPSYWETLHDAIPTMHDIDH